MLKVKNEKKKEEQGGKKKEEDKKRQKEKGLVFFFKKVHRNGKGRRNEGKGGGEQVRCCENLAWPLLKSSR